MKTNSQKGFLLIELIVAVGLFVVVVTISLGAIVSVLDSSRKVRTNKEIMDNLNSSIEYMARTIRFGKDYHCGSGGVLSVAQNCASGGANSMAVKFNGATLVYRLNGTRMEFSEDGGNNYKPLTSSKVIITRVQFYIFGTSKTDNIQPYVLVIIRGRVVSDATSSSVFDIQTVMSQREIDLNLP